MSGVPHESCFNGEKHKAHSWVYSAAGSWAPFYCEGIVA